MEKIDRHQAGQIAVEGIVHRICLASCLGSQCLYGTQAAGSSRRRDEIHSASHLGVVLVLVFFFLFNNVISLPCFSPSCQGGLRESHHRRCRQDENQGWEQRLIVTALAKKVTVLGEMS